MRIYYFKGFQLEYNRHTGAVTTRYGNNRYSHVEVNEDHHFHGNLLGLNAKDANLLHELAHHMVALAFGHATCPIVYNAAMMQPMPDNAQQLEWIITALSYFAMKKPMRHNHEWGAIRELAKQTDPHYLANILRTLWHGNSIRDIIVKNQ